MHETVDLAGPEVAWRGKLDAFGPELVVNAAAITDVGACEREPALARALHAEFAERAARASKALGAKFVQVSTDQVFDGSKKRPYVPPDEVRPINVYGRTKLEGERAALDTGALVLRTNIVGVRGRSGKPTFGEWLCAALLAGEKITLVDDFVTSSVYVGDFAEALVDAAEKGLRGLYHAAASEAASKYTFGRLTAEALGADFSNVRKGKLTDLMLDPPRPGYLALDSVGFEKAVGRRLPNAAESAAKLARAYRKFLEETKND